MIKLKDILLEGGNLFPDSVGIKQNEVMPTVKKIETDVFKHLNERKMRTLPLTFLTY